MSYRSNWLGSISQLGQQCEQQRRCTVLDDTTPHSPQTTVIRQPGLGVYLSPRAHRQES
jgi:hypothetical protein